MWWGRADTANDAELALQLQLQFDAEGDVAERAAAEPAAPSLAPGELPAALAALALRERERGRHADTRFGLDSGGVTPHVHQHVHTHQHTHTHTHVRGLTHRYADGAWVDTASYEQLLQLDESVGRSGVSAAYLRQLPTHEAAGTEGMCVVCLEDVAFGERLRALPCLHQFHVACVDRWLECSKVCPVCQHKVV
eukprot:TRINITY_DN13564_c0_g1_i1.p3 TRINITY_DN13564_c0_g1~~TRINITY_DN13564_c0_g1_i1.p3  ORF type:complete len:194 (+),score=69.15 TRINITY_DN13564_c0_g1_i1:3-584(+)